MLLHFRTLAHENSRDFPGLVHRKREQTRQRTGTQYHLTKA